MRSRMTLSGIFIVLLLLGGHTCRQRLQTVPSTTSEPDALVEDAVTSATAPPSTAATPTAQQPRPSTLPKETVTTTEGQLAVITATDPASEVNVRSLPSQAGDAIGYGKVGDTVVLGRSETADDGYTWHYVTFQNDTTVGWIRSDLLDIQAPTPAVSQEATEPNTSDILKQALDERCGNMRAIETYFITQSHTIYICKRRNQRLYLSQEQGTEQVVTAEEVEALGGGYIIGNGNFEYRLDSSSFVIVRFDDSGQQEEVLRESVVYTERY